MTYRRDIMIKNGSSVSSHAVACAMLARTSASCSAPRSRVTWKSWLWASAKTRMSDTIRATRSGLPFDQERIIPAIKHNSGDGGAIATVSARTATRFIESLHAPRRQLQREARIADSRNGCKVGGLFVQAIFLASEALARLLAFSSRSVPVGAGPVSHSSNPFVAVFISAFQRGSL